jgi:hypothetical protein
MIDIDPPDDESRRLWHGVGELAAVLPADWTLVGGLMVQLHALEHEVTDVRVTVDIDVLGQARPPGPLQAIDRALIDAGFEAHPPDPDNYGFRYERAGLIVDVLAPDGIRPPPTLDGSRRAVGIPGRSQALARSETVTVRIDGHSFEVRRPTLAGAILIKARALLTHLDPEAQRQDLLRLLSLVADPRAMAADLKRPERGWLRKAERMLRFDERVGRDDELVRRAQLAFRLLVADQ